MKKCLISLLFLVCSLSGFAQDCDIPVTVCLTEQAEDFPVASQQLLINNLRRVATQTGLSTDFSRAQFFITAKMDILDKEVVAGAPAVVFQNVGVTLYIGDYSNKKIFSTAYMEVKCAGTNETKVWNDAFKRVNGNNPQVRKMMTEGKQTIINWYDSHYKQIMKEAEGMMNYHKYREALVHLSSVPTCCNGYEEVSQLGLRAFQMYLDQQGQDILTMAQAVWAAGQDQDAAREAMAYLVMIDPSSSSYPEAQLLMKEIKQQVRNDIDFEKREKYYNSIDLEKRRIQAVHDIGVAYGKGQQPQTTFVSWIK